MFFSEDSHLLKAIVFNTSGFSNFVFQVFQFESTTFPSRANTVIFTNELLPPPLLLVDLFGKGLQLVQLDSITLIKFFARIVLPFLFK